MTDLFAATAEDVQVDEVDPTVGEPSVKEQPQPRRTEPEPAAPQTPRTVAPRRRSSRRSSARKPARGRTKARGRGGRESPGKPVAYQAKPVYGKWTLIQFYARSDPASKNMANKLNEYKSGVFKVSRQAMRRKLRDTGYTGMPYTKIKGISNLVIQRVTVSSVDVPEYSNVDRLPTLWLYDANRKLVTKDNTRIFNFLATASTRGRL